MSNLDRMARDVGATVAVNVDKRTGAVTVTVTGLGSDNETVPGVVAAAWYLLGVKRGADRATLMP